MNPVEAVKKTKIAYKGTTKSILQYLSMRNRSGNPVVTSDEIMKFFPSRITRKDTLERSLKTMLKNNFIKKVENGYIITNIGKHVPFIVASLHLEKLIRLGKRTTYANDDWSDNEHNNINPR